MCGGLYENLRLRYLHRSGHTCQGTKPLADGSWPHKTTTHNWRKLRKKENIAQCGWDSLDLTDEIETTQKIIELHNIMMVPIMCRLC